MAMVSSLWRRCGLMPRGNGVGNQGFSGKVLRLPDFFGCERVFGGADADHAVGKQGAVGNARLRHGFGHNRQIGAVGQQQADGVCLKAGYDVEFHLRPQRAEFAHGGHQPVEAGVAFHRQPQFARFAFDNLRHVAFGRGHLGQQIAGEFQQPRTGRREAQRVGFAFEQGGFVIVFQRADLVRQGGLGQEYPLRGEGNAAGFLQRQKGFQMTQFDNGFHGAASTVGKVGKRGAILK